MQSRQPQPVVPAHLLFEQQAHAVNHLVPIKGSGCDVEEEAVENRFRDQLQRNRQHERWQADQDIGCQSGQTCLLHADDAVRHKGKDTHVNPLGGKNLSSNYKNHRVL